MGLLDGGAQSIIGSVLGGFYLPGTLRKIAVDSNGVPTGNAPIDQAIKYQRDNKVSRDRGNERPANTFKFFILQLGVAVAPTVDDELIINNVNYRITDEPTADPANVCWTVMAVLRSVG